MCLAVQSQHGLDCLQDWALQSFAAVPDPGHDREEFSQLTEPFSVPQFHRLHRLQPVENSIKLELSWALPPALHLYKEKPLHYLAWLVGHEGRGSLVSFLRRKVWALSLTAGNAGDGYENNATYSLFPITITLTKQGFECVEQVAQAVFR